MFSLSFQDEIYEEPNSNSVAINRIKSMFESNSPVMTSRQIPVKPPVKPSYLRTANQNGNVPTLPGKTEEKPDRD